MFTSSDLHDGECTPAEYYGQFNTARELQVGQRYLSCKGDWMQTEYEIVYIGHGVALGVEVGRGVLNQSKHDTGLSSSGNKNLFYSEGMKAGWKYDDPRACFRLQPKD